MLRSSHLFAEWINFSWFYGTLEKLYDVTKSNELMDCSEFQRCLKILCNWFKANRAILIHNLRLIILPLCQTYRDLVTHVFLHWTPFTFFLLWVIIGSPFHFFSPSLATRNKYLVWSYITPEGLEAHFAWLALTTSIGYFQIRSSCHHMEHQRRYFGGDLNHRRENEWHLREGVRERKRLIKLSLDF